MALTRGIFPRDEQGNLLTKQGCATCDHPTWHVCLVGKDDKFKEAIDSFEARRRSKRGSSTQRSGSREERWESYHEGNRERDQEIIRRYRDDRVGMRKLASDFSISYQTVRKILLDNNVPLRGRGFTIANGAQ